MPKPNLQRNARTVRAAILARTENPPLPEVNWPELELDTTALPPYRPYALPARTRAPGASARATGWRATCPIDRRPSSPSGARWPRPSRRTFQPRRRNCGVPAPHRSRPPHSRLQPWPRFNRVSYSKVVSLATQGKQQLASAAFKVAPVGFSKFRRRSCSHPTALLSESDSNGGVMPPRTSSTHWTGTPGTSGRSHRAVGRR